MHRSRWLVVGILLCIVVALVGPLYISRSALASQSAPAAEVAALSPLLASSQPLGNADPRQTLSMSINLSLHDMSGLQQYIQQIYTPGSYLYHRYLRPADFAALYGPTAQEIQQVADYLRSQGFNVTHARTGDTVLDFSGTVAQAQQAFAVQIRSDRKSVV